MAFLNIPQEYASKSTEEIVANAGTGGLPLIAPGKYHGLFVTSELKPTKDGNGQFLEMKAVITQGEHRDVEFIERLNLINSNATAVKIAYETLAKIAKAVGFAQIPSDSSALHNKPLLLVIKTEKGTAYKDKVTGEIRDGKDKSVLSGFEPLPGIGVAGGAALAQQAAALPWGRK
jgi:hypothetical protein